MEGRPTAARVVQLLLVGLATAALLPASAARAATPSPVSNPEITLSAEPMLGGVVGPGSWLAVRVDVENQGPSVAGELRLSPSSGQGSTYSIAVELPSSARQQHFLYTQAGVFGARFDVSLIAGGAVLASVRIDTDADAAVERRVYLVSDRPERLSDALGDAIEAKGTTSRKIVSIHADDLPPRPEPWATVDLLVWHDVPSASLDPARMSALQTWLATGGDLVLIAGSLGPPMFSAFPADMLPYDPATTITLQPADVTALLGVLPTGALPIAAVGGPLQRGSVIWSAPAGDSVVGARQQYGQGTVTVLGIDPAIAWLAGSIAEDTIWARAVPTAAAWSDAQLPSDDQFLVNALGQLPAVQLPGGTQLLLLIVAYVAAIGPLNYFVLRRRDRREWAWLTMPVIIAVFGVGSYGIGIAQKGGDVIVNELVIVEGAVGSERGEADVHVGVFSPGRSTYDLRVGEAPLLSGTASGGGQRPDRPLDVLLGDPATLRGFGVGFGALRAFRAQTAVDTPRLDADFNLVENALAGTLTNSSAIALEDVSIVYAGAART